MDLYLLRRRGQMKRGEPEDRAMIVGAISEAHARVAAYERSKDVKWTDTAHSTCDMIITSEGVIHTVYVGILW